MRQVEEILQAQKKEHLAVIDIGSHSIRLVMFDRLARYPYPIFDERITAKLGKELDKTGNLNMASIETALSAMLRFAQILKPLSSHQVTIIATAAMRRAKNAKEFLVPAEKILQKKIKIISPEEEAAFMVKGLTSHIPNLTGIVVDLGGGSTEIALVKNGQVECSTSLPTGHLSTVSSEKIYEMIDEVNWLKNTKNLDLYGIGGSFRAIGKAYLSNSSHPVKILHRLHIKAKDRNDIVTRLQDGEKLSGIPEGRLNSIGTASKIIHCLFDATGANDLVVSGTSIRDGLVASFENEKHKQKDPILSVCKELSKKNERNKGEVEAIYKFLKDIFFASAKKTLKKHELRNRKRLIKAVCLLANLCWRETGEKRGKIAFERILSLPVYALSHEERVWLGMTLFHRYEGIRTPLKSITASEKILTRNERNLAVAVGLGIRFASIFCAGNTTFLKNSKLSMTENELIMSIKPEISNLMDFHSERRLKVFSSAIGLNYRIIQQK